MRKIHLISLLILSLGFGVLAAQEDNGQSAPEAVNNLLIVHVNMNVPAKSGAPLGYPIALVENIKHENPVTKLPISNDMEGQYCITVRFAFRDIDAFHKWFQQEPTKKLFQQFQQEADDVRMNMVGSFNPYDVARR
ncbi:MAG TPA: hypothetical protein VKA68_02255 [bacterium]|nr:hypothetical protein [bacterium]